MTAAIPIDATPLPAQDAPGDPTLDDPRLGALKSRFPTIEAFTSFLRRAVLDLEDTLSSQLTQIIEAPPFQALEASWVGLSSVVWAQRSAPNVKVKILDLNWQELSRDLHYTSEIRKSVLYTLLGRNELDTLGGEPFGITMIDHGLSMSVETEFDDLFTAQLLCAMAEACMCPLILSPGEDFFGETDAAWFTDARRIGNILNGEDYRAWQTLRGLSTARFMALVMPRVQLRGRYEDLDIGFRYHQWPSESNGLWGSGCFAFLRTVIAEYRRCAWFGFLKLVGGEQGVGAVLAPSDHPIPDGCARTDRAQVRMTRNLAHIYAENGFVPLAESTKNNMLYFVGNSTVTDCAGSAQAKVITQLQSVMIACRIVHYVKVQIRALIGQVKTAAECEAILNNWFDPYVSTSSGNTEMQARFPLQGARISVSESLSDSARFQCDIIVRPQYQIDQVLADISLKTDFGAGKLSEVT